MLLHRAFQGNGFAAARPNVLERRFRKIDVFKMIEMGQNSLASIERFRSAGSLAQPGKPLFNVFWKPDRKDGSLRYTRIAPSQGTRFLAALCAPLRNLLHR
jgi:hypothetical protein